MGIASKVKQLFTKEKIFSKKTFFILLLLIDLYITLSTVLKASSYSFMITDDFHDAVLVRDMFEGGLLLRTIKVVYMRYMTHAGAFTCFFTAYFSLGMVANNESLLSIFIGIDILLVIVGLYVFINYLCNYIGVRDFSLKLSLFSGIIIPWFAYYPYKQIFFWFSACNQYCLGLGILLFTLAALLRLTYKKDLPSVIITSILALICGGIYIIYVPIMVLFVILLNLAELLKNKKINIKLFIPSVVLAIFTFINVIAPGYRLRKEDEIQISAYDAFKSALSGTFHDELPNILSNPIFILFCIVAVYCGIRYKAKLRINGIRFLLSVLISIAMIVLSSFPVYMGYAYDSFEKIPNRCIFTIDFTSYTSILLLMFLLGIYLQQWSGIVVTKEFNAMVIFALSLIVITNYSGLILGNARYDMLDQINHNNINYYHTRVQETLDSIRTSPEQDVVVQLLPEAPSAILPFDISNDPTVWVNEDIASYFYKNSVRLE